MKASTRQKIPNISMIVGVVVVGIVGAVVHLSTSFAPKGDSAAQTGMFINIVGTAFLGGLGGGLVGLIIRSFIPKERVICPKCGATATITAHKSSTEGSQHTNICKQCEHEWE